MRLLLAVAALGAANAAKAPGSAQYAAIRPALDEIASLRAHVDGGACVPDLGAKADALCAAAEARVVADGGDAKAVRDVEKRLDALLRSIYAKQLRTARAAAVQAFRRAKLGGEYDALIKAREEFTALAEAASRAEWTYDEDERELEAALLAVSRASAAARDATIAAAQQRASVFAVLRKLVLELSAATAKRLGNDADCDAGLAARVPATNINLSGALQRGKSSLQISCVPDDSAALLGAELDTQELRTATNEARGAAMADYLAIRAFGRVFLASYVEIASKCARAPRLAPGPGEVVSWGTPQTIVIVWDGDSRKTIRNGWRARHHAPPATGAMHALYICAHGGVIFI